MGGPCKSFLPLAFAVSLSIIGSPPQKSSSPGLDKNRCLDCNGFIFELNI